MTKDPKSISADLNQLKSAISDTIDNPGISDDDKKEFLRETRAELSEVAELASWLLKFSKKTYISKDTIASQILELKEERKSPFNTIFACQFSGKGPEWDGTYQNITQGNGTYTRPKREKTTFNFTLRPENPSLVSGNSVGVYLIWDDEAFYVGKTQKNIMQRIDAHLSKVTATNNEKHHHPKRWQDYAWHRFQRLQGNSNDLSDLFFVFFHLSDFEQYLASEPLDARLSELESLLYFFFKSQMSEKRSLNSESNIGTEDFRINHENMWIK